MIFSSKLEDDKFFTLFLDNYVYSVYIQSFPLNSNNYFAIFEPSTGSAEFKSHAFTEEDAPHEQCMGYCIHSSCTRSIRL